VPVKCARCDSAGVWHWRVQIVNYALYIRFVTRSAGAPISTFIAANSCACEMLLMSVSPPSDLFEPCSSLRFISNQKLRQLLCRQVSATRSRMSRHFVLTMIFLIAQWQTARLRLVFIVVMHHNTNRDIIRIPSTHGLAAGHGTLVLKIGTGSNPSYETLTSFVSRVK
jgi:hypothetical protein